MKKLWIYKILVIFLFVLLIGNITFALKDFDVSLFKGEILDDSNDPDAVNNRLKEFWAKNEAFEYQDDSYEQLCPQGDPNAQNTIFYRSLPKKIYDAASKTFFMWVHKEEPKNCEQAERSNVTPIFKDALERAYMHANTIYQKLGTEMKIDIQDGLLVANGSLLDEAWIAKKNLEVLAFPPENSLWTNAAKTDDKEVIYSNFKEVWESRNREYKSGSTEMKAMRGSSIVAYGTNHPFSKETNLYGHNIQSQLTGDGDGAYYMVNANAFKETGENENGKPIIDGVVMNFFINKDGTVDLTMKIYKYVLNDDPLCGNRVVQAPEECDDGNRFNDDGCLSSCKNNVCGDTYVNRDKEECDDGNVVSEDGCSADCKVEFCGDEIIQKGLGEDCEPTLDLDCPSDCQLAECGNKEIEEGEECDDGNINNNDGCSSKCKNEFCGDKVSQADEECEFALYENDPLYPCNLECKIVNCVCSTLENEKPGLKPPVGSKRDCFAPITRERIGTLGKENTEDCCKCNENNGVKSWNIPSCENNVSEERRIACVNEEPEEEQPQGFCGDDIVQEDEDCEPKIDGEDICTADCEFKDECGDGIETGDEDCDDGNKTNDDNCTNDCKDPKCGDTIIQKHLGEQCDDGNEIDSDDCNNACKNTFCGDTIEQDNEDCDDGNTISGDGCSAECVEEFCGDGVKQPNHPDLSEQCDDGNEIDNDLCNNDCEYNKCTLDCNQEEALLNETQGNYNEAKAAFEAYRAEVLTCHERVYAQNISNGDTVDTANAKAVTQCWNKPLLQNLAADMAGALGTYNQAKDDYLECQNGFLETCGVRCYCEDEPIAFFFIQKAFAQELDECPDCSEYINVIESLVEDKIFSMQMKQFLEEIASFMEDNNQDKEDLEKVVNFFTKNIENIDKEIANVRTFKEECYKNVQERKQNGLCIGDVVEEKEVNLENLEFDSPFEIEEEKDNEEEDFEDERTSIDSRCLNCGINSYEQSQKDFKKHFEDIVFHLDLIWFSFKNNNMNDAIDSMNTVKDRIKRLNTASGYMQDEDKLLECLENQLEAIDEFECAGKLPCQACEELKRYAHVHEKSFKEYSDATSLILKDYIYVYEMNLSEDWKKQLKEYIELLLETLIIREEAKYAAIEAYEACQEEVDEEECYYDEDDDYDEDEEDDDEDSEE